MSVDVGAIVARARAAATDARRDGETSVDERERLKRVAAEFESMLLVQMLRDMREAGSWEDGDDKDTLGAEALFETLDVELATHLARVKGMGLAEELLGAFERMQPKAPTTESAPAAIAPAAGGAGAALPASPVAAPEADATSARPMVKPVSGAVTSDFGWRRDPFTNRLKFHQGVDIRAAYGQDVQAAGAGRVVFSGEQGGYGTSVVLEHPDGTRTRYAHLSAALVGAGDEVRAGEPVGRAGRSGRATGTHLHFEVIGRDGRRMAPQQWASADGSGRTLPGMDGRRTATSGD